MRIAEYQDAWKEKARQDAEERKRARARLRRALPIAVRVLQERGAGHVWLVGSLARGTAMSHSDLDLLVTGLTEQEAVSACREASDQTGVEVDVLVSESLDPRWRTYFERYGERCDE